MNICIFGLGYVGCVSLACLSNDGHKVIGIDINNSKANMINKGLPTIIEKDIDLLLKNEWESGRIKATDDYKTALWDSDVSIICVGTPNNRSGHLDMISVHRVAENIGAGLIKNGKFHVVVIRSTVLPGTNEKVGSIIEEHSGKLRGDDFEVVSSPEFLREGSAVEDFYNPPFTVIGTSSEQAFEMVEKVFQKVNGHVKKTSIEAAELIKFVNNSFHALKVGFANEIGNICKCLKIDAYELMELFCKDTKLNISTYYLKPGFAYGGSCLPKDLKALTMIAHDNYIKTTIIESIERSNDYQKGRLVDIIQQTGIKKVGILGISFKPGTDDLRGSPIVDVAELLIGKGYELKMYDKRVHLSNLIGANKQYIDEKLPHIEKLISDDLCSVISQSDLLVIANREDEFSNLPCRYPDKTFIDLVRIENNTMKGKGKYEGICW